VIVLVLMVGDHIAGQIRKENQLSSCYRKIEELEKKLEGREVQSSDLE